MSGAEARARDWETFTWLQAPVHEQRPTLSCERLHPGCQGEGGLSLASNRLCWDLLCK